MEAHSTGQLEVVLGRTRRKTDALMIPMASAAKGSHDATYCYNRRDDLLKACADV
jgi:hypothetical protein